MRDNTWLQKQLDFLLKTYFTDVKVTNPIEIKFGREAKFRFGSIRLLKPRGFKRISNFQLFAKANFSPKKQISNFKKRNVDPQKSIITITSMFARENVPVDVVRYTIAHELCHYAHGFSSANRRLFKYPHHGGVVNRELESRGAEYLTRAFKSWLKEYKQSLRSSSFGLWA